jgi:hypothetical protein
MNDTAGNRTNMTTLEGVNSYNSNNRLTAATYPDWRVNGWGSTSRLNGLISSDTDFEWMR